jgi:hypothetical protein
VYEEGKEEQEEERVGSNEELQVRVGSATERLGSRRRMHRSRRIRNGGAQMLRRPTRVGRRRRNTEDHRIGLGAGTSDRSKR